MPSSFLWSNYKPHLFALGFFFLATVTYFYPAYFQGKQLVQHDIMQYQGMAKSIIDHRKEFHEDPMWADNMFSGMPAYIISVDHYGNLFRKINDFLFTVTKPPSTYIFTSFIGFYILMMAFGMTPSLAVIGSIAFAMASFMFISIEAGHNAKVACISYMPLVFGGMVYAYRKNVLLGISLFGIGLALQIVNNHVQITYYLGFVLLAYGISELFRAIRLRSIPSFALTSVALVIMAALAVGTNASYFLTTQEYTQYSIRGKSDLTVKQDNGEFKKDGLDKDYVFNYSNSFTEPLTFLIPDYFGGASSGPLSKNSATAQALRSNGVDAVQAKSFISNVPLYFGEQPFVAGPIYLGAIVCFLFVLGLILVKDEVKYALVGVSIFGLLLTFGKNFGFFNDALFEYFPMYNKFRSVTMAVVIPQLCLPILGVMALDKLLQIKDQKAFIKPLSIAIASTAGLALLVFLFSGTGDYSTPADSSYQLPDWLLNAIKQDRQGMRTGDALRSMVLILLSGGICYAIFLQKLSKNIGLGLMAGLMLFDLWMVDKRFLNQENFEKKALETYYEPTEVDKILLQDKSYFRVFNLSNPFNDARTSYFHKSVGGYSPAKLRRYQDIIEKHLSNNNLSVLQMLNTKYVITGKQERPVEELPGYLGAAWFVPEIITVEGADKEIDALTSFNPAKTAIIDGKSFKTSQTQFDSLGTSKVELKSYKANELVYETEKSSKGFLVFSEIYYSTDWQAYIDNKPVDHVRVNYILRGLEIPEGKHSIKFICSSKTFAKGTQIAQICSWILIVSCLAGLGFSFWKNKK